MRCIIAVVGLLGALALVSGRKIKFVNRCSEKIWIEPLTNDRGPALREGIRGIQRGGSFTYNIADSGWRGRFWPKMGCNNAGVSCRLGQATPPCPRTGCQPPADTKVEFTFPRRGSSEQIWYDISLVDGYSVAATITPSARGNKCRETRCAIPLSRCPTNENDVGDLRVISNGRVVQCLAPCKRWNWPRPIGLGRDEKTGAGLMYCCPTPPVSSPQCRRGPVVRTKFVTMIQQACPTAYSFAYDDKNGLHTCPSTSDFTVSFC